MIPLSAYIGIGITLFCLGVWLVITRRSAIMALMGIELMLNAANLNFVAFSQKDPLNPDGQMAAIFVMVLAAAEVAVALAIVLKVYQHYQTIEIEQVDELKE